MAATAERHVAGITLDKIGGLPPIRASKTVSVTPADAPQATTDNVEFQRRARMSGLGQPQYLRNTLDIQRIQNALRSAERGDTWILFTLFRDMYASNSFSFDHWGQQLS